MAIEQAKKKEEGDRENGIGVEGAVSPLQELVGEMEKSGLLGFGQEEEYPESRVSKERTEKARRGFFGERYEEIMAVREGKKKEIYTSVFLPNPYWDESIDNKLKNKKKMVETPDGLTFCLTNIGIEEPEKDTAYQELMASILSTKADREIAAKMQMKFIENGSSRKNTEQEAEPPKS